MCENCDFIIHEGFSICQNCGIMEPFLDPSVQSYCDETRYMYCKRPYSRADRFRRLLLNLNGLQWVDHNIMDQCKPHFSSVENLKKWMGGSSLKRHRNKIASICRQLGMKWDNITEIEMMQAQEIFEKKYSKSYLVLLPYVLKKIDRHDLLQFVKIPSMSVQKNTIYS